MKQEISALMDGELFEDEAEGVFDRAKRDLSGSRDWEIYHLIGDTLRQPDLIHCDLGAKVRERMRDEPVVLAPRRRAARQKMRAIALSAAASLAAVGVVVWMSAQISTETAPRMAMQQPQLRPASAPMPSRADDYLMAHQEFSPSTDMNGSASYIRTASYRDGK
ncbi:MAG: anti-sigma factor [Gallionellales bacterium GWA2_60_18]|nr:MAG: anti-sigma factor [Gallionellales bacterium GWA2_60_18]